MAGRAGNRDHDTVKGPYPALEWLQRRAEGEAIAEIAARAGVTTQTIRLATNPYGPWPQDPSGGEHLEIRRRRWIALRRSGVGVREIARRDGVPHQIVSTWTRDSGPFPRPGTPSLQQVRDWTAARRAGQPVRQIAAAAGVSAQRVAAATKPHGPFPRRSQRIPDGVYCRNDLAALFGIASQTISTWHTQGHLPPPDFTTSRGRPLWLPGTIERWLPTSGLLPCNACGAYSRRPESHQGVHRLR